MTEMKEKIYPMLPTVRESPSAPDIELTEMRNDGAHSYRLKVITDVQKYLEEGITKSVKFSKKYFRISRVINSVDSVLISILGLRAKLYSYKMFEGEENKRCKGVIKSVVKRSKTHEDYKTCLFTGKEQIRKMNVIRSYKHEVYTEEVNKVALCPKNLGFTSGKIDCIPNNEEKYISFTKHIKVRSYIFCEELIAVHMKKTSLTMNKPVYLGMCILDLSKTMYKFQYNYIKPKYGDNAKLLFTDTDSLMYEIKPEDFYKDISGDVKDRFDTSDYPPNHISGTPTGCNKKVLGVFKDEVAGRCIGEFVGLRAKLYSYKMFEGEENKRCKGVIKSVVKRSITHEDYKTCLFTGKEQIRKMNVIRSYKHEVYTEEVNKVALCPNDDKRHILEDGINTLAWGHYKIPQKVHIAIWTKTLA